LFRNDSGDFQCNADFGLRYEVNTVIKEAHNLLGNFDPVKGMVQSRQAGSVVLTILTAQFCAARWIGLDIGGKGRTVLRAGAHHVRNGQLESFSL